jgi:hypothetical protein
MATYQEIRNLFFDSDLMEKTEVAVVVAANDLVNGTPTTAEKAWIAQTLSDPSSEAKKALMNVLAANKSQSVANIQSATDASLQANVNAVVPILVDALAGV